MLLKKFIVYSLSFIVISLFLAPLSVYAQSTPLPPTVSPVSPLYTDLLVHNLFHSFSCLAIGQSVIGQPCLTYLQGVPVLSQVNTSGGALGATTNIIGMLYQNPPIRTADYLASVGQGLGIVKTANAQVVGSGAQVLSPILKLWQVSRNISYVLMIIIFLVIGLMVMFRNKLNPQTVITTQAALPGLVIGLIMITFSYFFAGLISDMAFVGTNVVGYYFSSAQSTPTEDLVTKVDHQSILAIFSNFIGFTDYSGPISHIVEIIFNNVGDSAKIFIRFAAGVMAFQQGNMIGHAVPVIGDLVGIITGLVASGASAAATPQIAGFILNWVVIAILMYSMIKLLINLIKVYLNIIFLTISAPFQFLFSSLPGRQGIATGWMLNMLANVLAFPAVLAVLYFAAYLLNVNRDPFVISGSPSLISTHTLPLLGGLDINFINYLLAFGALTALPAIPEVISRTIGKASAAGQLIGQEIAGNLQGGRGYSNQWQQGFQAAGKIGQDWNTFRGTAPGYGPSSTVQGRTFFGKKINLPTWAQKRQ